MFLLKAAVASAASCADDGPWECAEDGCPSATVGCEILKAVCTYRFDVIFDTPPAELANATVLQRCRRTCKRCAPGWECSWVMRFNAAELDRSLDVARLNADLVHVAAAAFAADNASHAHPIGGLTRASVDCEEHSNLFYRSQRARFHRHEGARAAPAYGVLQRLIVQAATRWLSMLDVDALDPRELANATELFAWTSLLAPHECHREHTHFKHPADMNLLSAVYYAAAAEQHPIFFVDDGLTMPLPTCAHLEDAERAGRPVRLLHPRAGDLLIFPAWLRHGVDPSSGRPSSGLHMHRARAVADATQAAQAVSVAATGSQANAPDLDRVAFAANVQASIALHQGVEAMVRPSV